MPRPRKNRCIGSRPLYKKYGPKGFRGVEEIILKLEEYESIRLMDIEDLTQEECAKEMKVSRSTFQRIYKTARKKLAESIILNKDIIFSDEENNIKFVGVNNMKRGNDENIN
jgi:predicted DNA-binding protein (UPF0251 family)